MRRENTNRFEIARMAMNKALMLVIAIGIPLGAGSNVRADDLKDLMTAAGAGDVAKVKALLAASPGLLAAKTETGQTALHAAVLAPNAAAVVFLIEQGANVNAADARQETPLHVAVGSLRADSAKVLLKAGAGIDAKNRDGATPLHIVALSGTAATEDAARRKALTALLLDSKADHKAAESAGMTVLHLAAMKGRTELLSLLTEKGADISAKNAAGQTPLHLAAAGNHKDVIEWLLGKGAAVKAVDNEGATPLHSAVSRFRKEAAEQLIAAGAEVNARTKSGMTPLHVAASAGPEEKEVETHLLAVAEVLIVKGAEVDAKDAAGKTPLQLATEKNRDRLGKLLRDHGAAGG